MPLTIFLQKASGGVLLVVSGFLAYQLALLSWALLPGQDSKYQWVAPEIQALPSDNKIDTRKLQQQHLFGEAPQSKKGIGKTAAGNEVPRTTLSLTLTGVVAATEPLFSSAIISYKGMQDSYFINSKINGTGATVSEIFEDRVILDVDGVLQTLLLDGADKFKQQDNYQAQTQADTAKAAAEKKEVKLVEIDRQALLKDPGKLTDYIRISPYRKDGKVAGYRINPGKDRTLFEQAGLQNNDLAIALNGVDLTDARQAFSLMKEFPTMTEMSLTVERDGQLYELYFNIP